MPIKAIFLVRIIANSKATATFSTKFQYISSIRGNFKFNNYKHLNHLKNLINNKSPSKAPHLNHELKKNYTIFI